MERNTHVRIMRFVLGSSLTWWWYLGDILGVCAKRLESVLSLEWLRATLVSFEELMMLCEKVCEMIKVRLITYIYVRMLENRGTVLSKNSQGRYWSKQILCVAIEP